MKTRPTFAQACAAYVHRYTMQHRPQWALKPHTHTGGEHDGKTLFYAPQYASDAEWYANTLFPGDVDYPWGKRCTDCYSSGATWPLGKWLNTVFKGVQK